MSFEDIKTNDPQEYSAEELQFLDRIFQQFKVNKEGARNELYKFIKPKKSSNLYAAGLYILFPILAFILGNLLKDYSFYSFLIVVGVGWYIAGNTKDLFVKFHCIFAVLIYVLLQLIGIFLTLLGFAIGVSYSWLGAVLAIMIGAGLSVILYFIVSIILAINAFLGNKIRLPILTNFILDRIIEGNAKEEDVKTKKE